MDARDYALSAFIQIYDKEKNLRCDSLDTFAKHMKRILMDYHSLLTLNTENISNLNKECDNLIHEDLSYALQFISVHDFRINLSILNDEVSNFMLIYSLSNMINRALVLLKYFTPKLGQTYQKLLKLTYCNSTKLTSETIAETLCISRRTYYRYKKEAIRYLGFYFFEIVIPQIYHETEIDSI